MFSYYKYRLEGMSGFRTNTKCASLCISTMLLGTAEIKSPLKLQRYKFRSGSFCYGTESKIEKKILWFNIRHSHLTLLFVTLLFFIVFKVSFRIATLVPSLFGSAPYTSVASVSALSPPVRHLPFFLAYTWALSVSNAFLSPRIARARKLLGVYSSRDVTTCGT